MRTLVVERWAQICQNGIDMKLHTDDMLVDTDDVLVNAYYVKFTISGVWVLNWADIAGRRLV